MKTSTFVKLLTAMALSSVMLFAQEVPEHGPGFVDENGDGYNDLAPDLDGDGIPNGFDEDYEGAMRGRGPAVFIDEDGDGFNDNAPDNDGDGIPNFYDEDFVRQPRGMGRGFIDANEDGIDDRLDQDGDGIPNHDDDDFERPAGRMGQRGFIDANEDGVNDRFDHDGDGVPNFEDEDFDPAEDGWMRGGMPGGRGRRPGN